MRVLLVNPGHRNVYGRGIPPPYPPLGLLYVASSLEEAGCEVQILDWDTDHVSPASFSYLMRSNRPELVGITAATPQMDSALAIARMVKETGNARVVLGGAHASMLPEESISHGHIDFVVVGEGEETVKELAAALEGGEFEGIGGLWFKEGSEIRRNRARAPAEDLDQVRFPARHLLRNPKGYSPPEARSSSWISIITSRGCPELCTFCATPKLLGRRIRRRSVANVVSEIEEGVARFGAREVHIADDCFTSDREWVFGFCEALQESDLNLNLYFMNGLRADQIDRELLSSLKEAGLRNVGFGVESGNQEVLNRSRKGLNLKRVRETYRICRSLNLSTWGFFIIGLPGETPETAKDTIDFAIDLDPDYAKFFALVPYPGTEVYDELSRRGLITNRQYSDYALYARPVFRLPDMDEEEMASILHRAYRRFYLRPSKILRHLLPPWSQTGLKLKLRGAKFLRRFLLTR